MAKKIETNVEFMTRIMEFSKNGAIMQCFIIEAMAHYSKEIKDADLSNWEGGLISPDAWRACSIEILKEIENRRN